MPEPCVQPSVNMDTRPGLMGVLHANVMTLALGSLVRMVRSASGLGKLSASGICVLDIQFVSILFI